MKITRRQLRKIINEVSAFGCNKHSLGYIDAHGSFLDISADEYASHEEWLSSQGLYDWEPAQNHWIKLSNANELTVPFIHNVSQAQLNGLIDMWIKCKDHSQWIMNPESHHLNIYNFDFSEYEELTIPEFIEKHDKTGLAMEKFFEGLLSAKPSKFAPLNENLNIMSIMTGAGKKTYKQQRNKLFTKINSSPANALRVALSMIPSTNAIAIRNKGAPKNSMPKKPGEWYLGLMANRGSIPEKGENIIVMAMVATYKKSNYRIMMILSDIIEDLPKLNMDHIRIEDANKKPGSSKALSATLAAMTALVLPNTRRFIEGFVNSAGKEIQKLAKDNPDVLMGLKTFDYIFDQLDSGYGELGKLYWMSKDPKSFTKYLDIRSQAENKLQKELEGIVNQKFGSQIEAMLLDLQTLLTKKS